MASTSTKPEMQSQVDVNVQFLTRWMGLLRCCGLQQVSPSRDIPLTIIYFKVVKAVGLVEASFAVVMVLMIFMTLILQNSIRASYYHRCKGGTLWQKTIGEWFTAHGGIMAFTSKKPELQSQVDEYTFLSEKMIGSPLYFFLFV